MKINVEHCLRYNFNICQKKDYFDILNKIIKYVTLVQLMDSLGNVNCYISIVGYQIFDSNYEKALCLTQKSLDLICSLYIGEEQVSTFQSVFYAVRYIWAPIHHKKDKHDTVSKDTIQENNN